MDDVPTREELDELWSEVRDLREAVERLEHPPAEIERVELRLTKAEIKAIVDAPTVVAMPRAVGESESPRTTALKALRAALGE